jgi:DNA-binding Xre family transcriptional regulator
VYNEFEYSVFKIALLESYLESHKTYYMLLLNLKRIFKARGIDQPYKFLVKSGFVPFTAHKYKNSKVEQIRLDHIEQLCILLNCTPNDIFEWMPNDLLDDRDDHPLQVIRRREKKIEIAKMLSKLSLSRLEEVEKILAEAVAA